MEQHNYSAILTHSYCFRQHLETSTCLSSEPSTCTLSIRFPCFASSTGLPTVKKHTFFSSKRDTEQWCTDARIHFDVAKRQKKKEEKKIRSMYRWTLSLERCHLSFCEMEAEAYSKKKFTQTDQTNCCLAQTPTMRGAFYTCAFMLPLACWKHITLPAFLSPRSVMKCLWRLYCCF